MESFINIRLSFFTFFSIDHCYNYVGDSVIRINGGNKIGGKIYVSGSKNTALPLICGALLTKGVVVLKNVPRIDDVFELLQIIKTLNVKVVFKNDKLRIDSRNICYKSLAIKEVTKIRASSYLMGVMLALFNKFQMSYPGGCDLGGRGLDFHYMAFTSLGYRIKTNGLIEGEKISDYPHDVFFKTRSVGATINTLFLSGYLNKVVKIYYYAHEPEVKEVIKFLKKIGYKIYEMKDYLLVASSSRLKKYVRFNNVYDRIEASSYLMIGLLSNKLIIKNSPNEHMAQVIKQLRLMGGRISVRRHKLIAKKSKLYGTNVYASSYPGFPTDCQPLIAALALYANTKSEIKDNIYHNRFSYAKSFLMMNGNVEKNDYTLYISPSKLEGAVVKGYDLRGVFAIVIASLFAKGSTVILDGEIAKRGYEDLDKKLKNIGVDIKFE